MRKSLALLLILIVLPSACTQQPAQPESDQLPQEEQSAALAEEAGEEENTESTVPDETAEISDPEPTAEVEPDAGQELSAEDNTEDDQFQIYNPYQALSEEDMIELGAADFSGTDLEIAQQILAWQGEYMQYFGNPMDMPGVSHPMRWNYFLPGIFPVSDMVKERVTEDGKIYGLCSGIMLQYMLLWLSITV